MANGAPVATERTLRASLQFRIDPRGFREVLTRTTDLERKLIALDKAIAKAGEDTTEVDMALNMLSNSMGIFSSRAAKDATNQIDELQIRFREGAISVEELHQELISLEAVWQRLVTEQALSEEISIIAHESQKATEQVRELANTVQSLESIGQEIAGYARMFTDPLRRFAAEYVQMAGDGDRAAQAWVRTTEELGEAQARVGGVAIDAILPIMELTADVMEKAADFADRYPELVQAVFGIGTAIILATSLQAAVSKGIRLIADAKTIAMETKRFIAVQIERQAANKQLIAATMMDKAASTQMAAAGAQQAGGAGSLMGGGIRGAISAIGGIGGLVTALSVIAAAAGVVAVGIKVKNLADDVRDKTNQMEGHWAKWLDNTVGDMEDATQLARRYNDKQRDVNKAYEDGGIIAEIFFDRAKMVNAGVGSLSRALQDTSTSYDDYVNAVQIVNDELGDSEQALYLVTRAQYEYRQEIQTLIGLYDKGEVGLRNIADAMLNSTNVFNRMAGAQLSVFAQFQEASAMTRAMPDWEEYLDRQAAARDRFFKEEQAAWDEMREGQIKAEEDRDAAILEAKKKYQAALLQLELDTETERQRIITEGAEETGRKLTDTWDRIAEMVKDHHEAMREAEEEYFKQRAERARDFGIDTVRQEEDHQRSMRRMREDSMERQWSAVRARDAIMLLQEQRDYAKNRGRAEEDYRVMQQRRHEDFARQLADMEKNFQDQQAARQKQHEKAIAALQKQLAEEQAAIDKANDERLAALEEQRVRELRGLYDSHEEQTEQAKDFYTQTNTDLKTNYRKRRFDARKAQDDELRDAYKTWTTRRQAQGIYLGGELTDIRAHYTHRLTLLQNWMTSANAIVNAGTSGLPGKQAGGYVGSGTYRVGEAGYEYVLDHPTTRMAELAAGGSLTMAGMRGIIGGGKTINVTYSQVVNVPQGQDPAAIARVVQRETLRTITDVFKQVK